MSFTKYLTSFSTAALGLTMFFSSVATVPVDALEAAGVSILPSSELTNPADALTKSWVIQQIAPGEEKCSNFVIGNGGDEVKNIRIKTADAKNANGSFTFDEINSPSQAGSWITIAENEVKVEPESSVGVGFCNKVPSGTEDGEYVGVVFIEELSEDTGSASGFKVVNLVGLRFYSIVGTDQTQGIDIPRFTFLTPDESYTDTDVYRDFIFRNSSRDLMEVYLGIDLKNISNNYTKIEGTITLETPSGEEVVAGFNRDYGSFDETIPVPFFNIPGSQWQVGNYKATFNFATTPVITAYKENVQNISPTNTVVAEFNMTQEMLDKLKADALAAKDDPNAFKRTTPKPANSTEEEEPSGFSVGELEEPKEDKKDKDDDDNNTVIILSLIGGGIILILIAIIGFMYFKQKKSKKDETKTEVVKETSKTSDMNSNSPKSKK